MLKTINEFSQSHLSSVIDLKISEYAETNILFVGNLATHIQSLQTYKNCTLYTLDNFDFTYCIKINRNELSKILWDLIVILPNNSLTSLIPNISHQEKIPLIIKYGKKAENATCVCIQKSGTNLLANLFKTLEFKPFGDGIKESYSAYHPLMKKLGIEKLNGSLPYDFFLSYFREKKRIFFLHHFPFNPTQFISDEIGYKLYDDKLNPITPTWNWLKSHEPPLFFLYRDPRDVIISLIYYLKGKPSGNFWQTNMANILNSFETINECIDFILTCTPDIIINSYRDHFWLLKHPNVCNISFEELVGLRGGGTNIKQQWAIIKIIEHLSISGDVDKIANSLFSTKSRTFRKGQIGQWKEHFSTKQVDEFNKKFNDILEQYAYL